MFILLNQQKHKISKMGLNLIGMVNTSK